MHGLRIYILSAFLTSPLWVHGQFAPEGSVRPLTLKRILIMPGGEALAEKYALVRTRDGMIDIMDPLLAESVGHRIQVPDNDIVFVRYGKALGEAPFPAESSMVDQLRTCVGKEIEIIVAEGAESATYTGELKNVSVSGESVLLQADYGLHTVLTQAIVSFTIPRAQTRSPFSVEIPSAHIKLKKAREEQAVYLFAPMEGVAARTQSDLRFSSQDQGILDTYVILENGTPQPLQTDAYCWFNKQANPYESEDPDVALRNVQIGPGQSVRYGTGSWSVKAEEIIKPAGLSTEIVPNQKKWTQQGQQLHSGFRVKNPQEKTWPAGMVKVYGKDGRQLGNAQHEAVAPGKNGFCMFQDATDGNWVLNEVLGRRLRASDQQYYQEIKGILQISNPLDREVRCVLERPGLEAGEKGPLFKSQAQWDWKMKPGSRSEFTYSYWVPSSQTR